MPSKKRGLGKGLGALLKTSLEAGEAAENVAVAEPLPEKKPKSPKGKSKEKDHISNSGLKSLPLEKISGGPFQPRHTFSEKTILQLAESIKTQGVLQPIVVRETVKGSYEIIAGERRWRAAQKAGLTEIPAIVKDVPESTALAIALIENIQRENLNPIDEAKALKRLSEEMGGTQQKLAESVGKSRTHVTNLLRLLSLSQETQALLAQGHIEMGHARALLSLPTKLQDQTAQSVAERGLSVRETEKLVARLQDKAKPTPQKTTTDPNIRRLQDDLSEKLGAQVTFRHSAKKGQGQVVIRYNDLEELDGILAHIR